MEGVWFPALLGTTVSTFLLLQGLEAVHAQNLETPPVQPWSFGKCEECGSSSPLIDAAERHQPICLCRTDLDQLMVLPEYSPRRVVGSLLDNANDALDKVRMNPKNDAGEEPEMKIRISIDKDKRMIYMQDGGVGMTKDELKNNLLSVRHIKEKFRFWLHDTDFYTRVSSLSERVKVASKSDASDKQWIWESTGDGSFYVYEDPRGNTLGRGTESCLS